MIIVQHCPGIKQSLTESRIVSEKTGGGNVLYAAHKRTSMNGAVTVYVTFKAVYKN